MEWKKNQEVRLDITGTTAQGAGVGRLEGMAVFVPLTAPGDTARVKLVKVAKNYAYGRLEELLSPAPQPAARRRGKKPTFILKDVRLFLNTVTRGLSMIQAAWVRADCQRQDTDDAIRLTITIPK